MLFEYLEIPRIYKAPETSPEGEKSVRSAIHYYKSCNYSASKNILYTLLAKECPNDEKSQIYNNLGCSEFCIGKYFEAKAFFIDAMSLVDEKNINGKISIMLNLAFTQVRIADYESARKTFDETTALLYSMKCYSKFYLALIHTGFTIMARERGDLDEASKNIDLALDYSKEYIEKELSIIYIYEIYSSIKRMKGVYQESLDISINNYKNLKSEVTTHPMEGMIKNSIALSLRSMASYTRALSEVQEGYKIMSNFFDDLHPDVALLMNTQGLVYHNMDQYYEGMSHISESMKIYRYFNMSNHPDMAKFYNNLGLTYKGMGMYKEAIDNYKMAIEVLISIFGPDHNGIAPQYNNIGVAYKKMGQYRESLSCYLKCYRILEKSMTSNHPLVADILLNIGYLMHLMGSRDDVHPVFKRSMIIYSKFYGEKHLFTGKAKIKNRSTDLDKVIFSLNSDEI